MMIRDGSDEQLRAQFRTVTAATSRLGIDPDRIVDAIQAGYPLQAISETANSVEAMLKSLWADLKLDGSSAQMLDKLITRCENALKNGRIESYDAWVFSSLRRIKDERNRGSHHQVGRRRLDQDALADREARDLAWRLPMILRWYQDEFLPLVGPRCEPIEARDGGLTRLAAEMVERRKLGDAFTLFLGAGCFLDSGSDSSVGMLTALGASGYAQFAANLNARRSEPDIAMNVLGVLRSVLPQGYVELGQLLARGWFDMVVTSNVDDYLERGLKLAGVGSTHVEQVVFEEGKVLDLVARLTRPSSRIQIVKLCGELTGPHWRVCTGKAPSAASTAGIVSAVFRGSTLIVGARAGDIDLSATIDAHGDSVWLIDSEAALGPETGGRVVERSPLHQRLAAAAPCIDTVFLPLTKLVTADQSTSGITASLLARSPEGAGSGEGTRLRRLSELQADIAQVHQELAQHKSSNRSLRDAEREFEALDALVTQVNALSQAGEGTVLGNFRVGELLGRGTLASVHRASNIFTARIAAIKVLSRDLAPSASARARFFNGAASTRAVNHPNVLRVYDEGIEGPWCYYVMDLVEGPSLEMALSASSLSSDQRWSVAHDLLSAVAEAHSEPQPVVHGGLKPADVLLTADADVRVSDFGLGPRPVPWAPGSDGTLSENMTFYSAPEVQRGSSIATVRDPRVDVFSLGRILLRVFTNIPASEREALRYAVDAGGVRMLLSTARLPGPAVSTLGYVLSRAMEFEPSRRFASAREMLLVFRDARARAHGFAVSGLSGLSLQSVPAGSYLMGSPKEEPLRGADEQQRPVEITRRTLFGTTPVTRLQWGRVWGEEVSHLDEGDLPVERTSWWDAIAFCNALSLQSGLRPCYRLEDSEIVWDMTAEGYRLPTEAEWEFAARAGSATLYSSGDAEEDLEKVAWYSRNAENRLRPVSQKAANAWGLADMHGNVWEWCWDWYGPYGDACVVDPIGAGDGTERVVRGGSCRRPAEHCRAAHRYYSPPSNRGRSLGFRVVRNAPVVTSA